MSHSVAGAEGRWAGILFTWSGESGMVSLTTRLSGYGCFESCNGNQRHKCSSVPLHMQTTWACMLILFQQHIVSFYLWCAFQNRWFIAILNAHLWWFHYVFVLITGYWQSVKIKTLFCFFSAHYDQSNTTILAQPIVWVWGEVICLSG